MSSLADSEACFDEQGLQSGLDAAAMQALKTQGINTLAKLAFAFGQPGDTPSEADLGNLLAGGGDAAAVILGSVSSLRRPAFDAQTLMVHQVKSIVENREDDTKVELASAERNERVKRQKTRLQGLGLVGDLECGHVCYDLVFKMLQSNCVTYLAPHKFVSRKSELSMGKPSKQIVLDSSSRLTVKSKENEVSCDTSTELMLGMRLLEEHLQWT